ncbi:MAG TPA: hypothetical protein H9694_00245 [Firmicutes bacterium]|nr:hypothetical protein [Bacillota bacterium]
MKKVILRLESGTNPALAFEALNELSGVIHTDIQGGQAEVLCGRRMSSATLLNALKNHGCAASEISCSIDT